MFLIAALLLAAPILCVIRGTADRLFFGGGRADEVFSEINVLEQKSSPFLRQSSRSIVVSTREEEELSTSSSPSSSPTVFYNKSDSTSSS